MSITASVRLWLLKLMILEEGRGYINGALYYKKFHLYLNASQNHLNPQNVAAYMIILDEGSGGSSILRVL